MRRIQYIWWTSENLRIRNNQGHQQARLTQQARVMSALALGPVGESDELRSRRGWEFRGMHCGNRCVEFYTRRFLSVNNCRYNWRKKTRQGGMVVIFGLVAVAYSCCAMVDRRHRFACAIQRLLIRHRCGRCTAPTRPRSSLGRQTAGGLRFF